MEKIDIKSNLRDEPIFKGFHGARFQGLSKKGIHTIEDFLNNDVESFMYKSTSEEDRDFWRGCHNVLQYKYLNKPLIDDALLDVEIKKNHKIYNDTKIKQDIYLRTMNRLGIGNHFFKCDIESFVGENIIHRDKHGKYMYSYYLVKENYKIIDVMKLILEHDFDGSNYFTELAKIYVEYYEKKMNKNNVNDIDTLEGKKNEIEYLLAEKQKLDERIAQLQEQIRIIEENKKEEEPKKNGK